MGEKIEEGIIDFANAVEAACVNLRRVIGEAHGVDVEGAEKKEQQSFVKEETFTVLKFEDSKGERLGPFQIASKANNLPDKFQHAYGVLRQNNATIKSRYHGPGYAYSYWLYGEDRIFRQRLKKEAGQ